VLTEVMEPIFTVIGKPDAAMIRSRLCKEWRTIHGAIQHPTPGVIGVPHPSPSTSRKRRCPLHPKGRSPEPRLRGPVMLLR